MARTADTVLSEPTSAPPLVSRTGPSLTSHGAASLSFNLWLVRWGLVGVSWAR